MSVLARVLGKFLSDQEHDFLVGWLVNKCCLHVFKQNGYVIYGLVLKYMMKNIFFVFLRNFEKNSCDFVWGLGNVLLIQLIDFGY